MLTPSIFNFFYGRLLVKLIVASIQFEAVLDMSKSLRLPASELHEQL